METFQVSKSEYVEFLKYQRELLERKIASLEDDSSSHTPSSDEGRTRGKRGAAKNEVISLLSNSQDGLSVSEIEEATKLASSTVYNILGSLKKEGKAISVNGKWKIQQKEKPEVAASGSQMGT